jgi:hypothetical protein
MSITWPLQMDAALTLYDFLSKSDQNFNPNDEFERLLVQIGKFTQYGQALIMVMTIISQRKTPVMMITNIIVTGACKH